LQSVTKHCYLRQTRSGGRLLPILARSPCRDGENRLGDPPFEDRPEVTFLKDWLEVSAPVQVRAALAQVPQGLVPAEQPLAPVLAARLLALVPVRVRERARVLAPEEASEQALALAPGPEPELQPSVALARARGPRLCAHT